MIQYETKTNSKQSKGINLVFNYCKTKHQNKKGTNLVLNHCETKEQNDNNNKKEIKESMYFLFSVKPKQIANKAKESIYL